MRGILADVVKVGAEVGEKVVERERLRFGPANLLEFLRLVERDFRPGRFDVERGVPRPRSVPLKRLPAGWACVNAAFTMCA